MKYWWEIEDRLDKSVTAVATHTHSDHTGDHHEFSQCLVHHVESLNLTHPKPEDGRLFLLDFGQEFIEMMERSGYDCEPEKPLITALPYEGYDVHSYELKPAFSIDICT